MRKNQTLDMILMAAGGRRQTAADDRIPLRGGAHAASRASRRQIAG